MVIDICSRPDNYLAWLAGWRRWPKVPKVRVKSTLFESWLTTLTKNTVSTCQIHFIWLLIDVVDKKYLSTCQSTLNSWLTSLTKSTISTCQIHFIWTLIDVVDQKYHRYLSIYLKLLNWRQKPIKTPLSWQDKELEKARFPKILILTSYPDPTPTRPRIKTIKTFCFGQFYYKWGGG